MRSYGGRWLGIWSPNDEAINGLKATLNLSLSFVAPMVPRERVFLSDSLALLSRPYYWVLSPVFNWLIKPVVNNLVRRLVVKSAQGNNRPTAEVIAVLPSPVLLDRETRFPPLPPDLDRRIVEKADRFAGHIAPKLRQLLAEPSFTSGLERFGKALSGKELVHTSYFDHPEILQLLCLNMAWSRRDQGYASRVNARKPGLVSWFALFKSAVGEKVLPLPQPPDLVVPTPAHPRWLTPRRRRLDGSLPEPASSQETAPAH